MRGGEGDSDTYEEKNDDQVGWWAWLSAGGNEDEVACQTRNDGEGNDLGYAYAEEGIGVEPGRAKRSNVTDGRHGEGLPGLADSILCFKELGYKPMCWTRKLTSNGCGRSLSCEEKGCEA